MAQLISIQTGKPAFYPPVENSALASKPWLTGFFKTPVSTPVQIDVEGIAGDGQADLISHGGPDKAICVYASEHFPFWRTFLENDRMDAGGFGENFTTEGLLEDNVHIGDRFRIGSTIVEVSQPRQPCWKLARRWDRKTLTPEVQRTGKTGWYFRVIQPGKARAGESIEHVEARQTGSQWSIARANVVMYDPTVEREEIEQLVAVEALSASWREQLARRL